MSKTILYDGVPVECSIDPATAHAYTDAELLEIPRSDALKYLLNCMRRADNAPMPQAERAQEASRVLCLVAWVLAHGKKHEPTVDAILNAYSSATA